MTLSQSLHFSGLQPPFPQHKETSLSNLEIPFHLGRLFYSKSWCTLIDIKCHSKATGPQFSKQVEIRRTQRSPAMQGEWFKVWAGSQNQKVPEHSHPGQRDKKIHMRKYHQGRAGLCLTLDSWGLHLTRIY